MTADTDDALRRELADWLRTYGLDPYRADALSVGLMKEGAPIAALQAENARLTEERDAARAEAKQYKDAWWRELDD